MAIPILQTKLYIPPPCLKLVPRVRLVERLNEGTHCKLTIIAAQAGAGKTTLVSEWLGQLTQDVVWLSLDEADSNPERFWLYAIAALQTVHPDLGRAAQSMLEAPVAPSFERLLTSLINEVAVTPDPILLVLDDYHFISDAKVHETLNFFLDHLPPQLHLVVLTREDPPFTLARLRVQQQVTEIRTNDLRFTRDEAHQFLNQTMGLGLSVDEVATLTRRTEGWVAGLQMAALSLQNVTDTTRFIAQFAGDDRYLVDYLMAEVFERQPPPLQDFLLQTAILKRFSVALCNAVTGQTDSRILLNQLEQTNLFLSPLDNRREWYRYHRLFGDLLRYRLAEAVEPAIMRELHHRAACWFAQQGDIGEAVHHYLAAEELTAAAELIESIGINLIVQGHLRQVLDWLASFPPEFLRTRPLLCICQAWILNISGQAVEVEQWLADAEQALPNAPSQQQREIRGLTNTVRAYLARRHRDVALSMDLLRQALTDLPSENLLVRSTVNLNLGFNYSIIGELALADQALASAVADGQRGKANYVTLIAMAMRANVYAAQGKLRAAKWLYQEAIDTGLAQNGGRPFPPAGYAYAGLGQVLYEQNDLTRAEEHLRQAIKCGELIGDWSMTRRGLLPLAWLKQIQGDSTEAHALWQRALSVVQQADSERVEAQLMVHRSRLWLAQAVAVPDDATSLTAAVDWAETYEQDQHDAQSYPEALAQLTLAWLALVQGQTANALACLKPVAETAEIHGQIDNLIKIFALQALVHDACGESETAEDTIHRALALAAAEGYVQTFFDYGPPMQALLQRVTVGRDVSNYAAKLLTVLTGEPESTPATPTKSSTANLVEPLNERERQILRLMAARCSNQQIADELHLSINTVKWHARHIYGKLGVSNRVAAVDLARELSIF